MPVSAVPLTFILGILGVVGSLTFMALALTNTSSTDNSSHPAHEIDKSIDSIQLANVEHSSTVVREGDAKLLSALAIDSERLEPDNNCEFCTQVTYKPATEGMAAVAYQIDEVDLSLSKRIVFFAKGQNGGEQLFFVAAGKSIENGSGIIDNIDKDLFPDLGFGIMTKKIVLSNHWKRYQIGLFNNDLRDITHPFGFIMFGGNQSQVEKIFLKGITFDDNYPTDPVSTLPNSG